MKKRIFAVIVLTVSFLLLTACAQKNKEFVGAWVGMTAEEISLKANFTSDNNVTITLGDQDIGFSGTYSIDGDTATIMINNEDTGVTATLTDGELIFTSNGESVVMKKTN